MVNRVLRSAICVGSICVTPQQFQAMVAAANQSGSASTPTSPSSNGAAASSSADSSATPPVLQVNGDPLALGQIQNGADDTIQYVATDQNGLTSTSTRTVIIQAANDNEASTTSAANDNTPPLDATGTTATSSSQ
jgi:hypothetical protein